MGTLGKIFVVSFLAIVVSSIVAMAVAVRETHEETETIEEMGCFSDGGLVFCPGHVCLRDGYLDPKARHCVPFVSPRMCPRAEGEER